MTTGLPKPRYQQTRFQQRVAQAIASLEGWASNPWRRLSLQLIVLLISFSIGGAIGTISGAHLNPALTIALAITGKFALHLVPGYILAQFTGAFTGAILV